MEFDNRRLYTCVSATELHIGDKVYVGNDLAFIKDWWRHNCHTDVLTEIRTDGWERRFGVEREEIVYFALAYLVERKENCTNCGKTGCSAHSEHDDFKVAVCSNWIPKAEPKTEQKAENCTNCVYEGSAGCSIVEICGENKLTHRCHMYEAKDTKRNLCDSCKHSFAECPATSDDIKFGDGVGNDNVYECDKYEQKAEHKCETCRYVNCGFKDFNSDNKCDRWEEEQKAEKHADYNHCEEAKKACVCAMTNACPNKHYRPFRDTNELVKAWIAKRMITYPDLCLPHIWVRYKNLPESKGMLINGFEDNIVYVMYSDRSMQELFDKFEFLDGSPCGVEE